MIATPASRFADALLADGPTADGAGVKLDSCIGKQDMYL